MLTECMSAIIQCFGKTLPKDAPAHSQKIKNCAGTALACLTTPFKKCFSSCGALIDRVYPNKIENWEYAKESPRI